MPSVKATGRVMTKGVVLSSQLNLDLRRKNQFLLKKLRLDHKTHSEKLNNWWITHGADLSSSLKYRTINKCLHQQVQEKQTLK
jgi:hypothetical protein